MDMDMWYSIRPCTEPGDHLSASDPLTLVIDSDVKLCPEFGDLKKTYEYVLKKQKTNQRLRHLQKYPKNRKNILRKKKKCN